jgi:hypothetical protein
MFDIGEREGSRKDILQGRILGQQIGFVEPMLDVGVTGEEDYNGVLWSRRLGKPRSKCFFYSSKGRLVSQEESDIGGIDSGRLYSSDKRLCVMFCEL